MHTQLYSTAVTAVKLMQVFGLAHVRCSDLYKKKKKKGTGTNAAACSFLCSARNT